MVSSDVRKPTDDEKAALASFFTAEGQETMPEDMEFVAVFDHYCTGGPGYCGVVYVVLWNGSPGNVTTLIMQDGALVRAGEMVD